MDVEISSKSITHDLLHNFSNFLAYSDMLYGCVLLNEKAFLQYQKLLDIFVGTKKMTWIFSSLFLPDHERL